MPEKDSKVYHEARKLWNTVVNVEASNSYELKLQLEIHKRLLSLFQPGSYYYYIFNIYTAELEFMSAGVTDVLGYKPEEMSVAFIIDHMHPDDRPVFLNNEQRVVSFFKDLPFEKVKNYKVQYDYRLRAKDNKYVRILQQSVQIDYDDKNYYRTLGIHTDISHIKQDGPSCFSIIGLDGEPSYYNIKDPEVFRKSFDIFTKREREILKCIVEGKNSKEIADTLHISLNTVGNHRKNILEKADTKTAVELVTKAMQEGWV